MCQKKVIGQIKKGIYLHSVPPELNNWHAFTELFYSNSAFNIIWICLRLVLICVITEKRINFIALPKAIYVKICTVFYTV